MPLWLEFTVIVGLFLLGLRGMAFFSGAETAYYRLSLPRLMIDASAGDKTSGRLLSLARNPTQFMATMLIGNNLANYLITCALGWGGAFVAGGHGDWLEIVVTVCMSPLIFLLGELLPKSVYYRAPLRFLRRDINWMRLSMVLFYPASAPLSALTRLVERLKPGEGPALDTMLGRNHLAQVMSHGHREGVLTDAQIAIASGLLQVAPQPVRLSMIPADRVLGVPESAGRHDVVEFARRFGIAQIAVHRDDDPAGWFGYFKLAEVTLDPRPLSQLLRTLPRLDHDASKLEAMQTLRSADETLGVVVDAGRVLGLVNQRGLAEQLLRPAAPPRAVR